MVACESRTINPFENSNGSFSLYGAMNLSEADNYVRIKYQDTPFFVDSSELRPITASIEELESGEVKQLQEYVIPQSSFPTRNFLYQKELEPRKQYQITVNGEEGETTNASFLTPGVTQPFDIFPPVDCTVEKIYFRFDNVSESEQIIFQAGVNYEGSKHWGTIESVDQFRRLEGEDAVYVRLTARNLLVDIFPPPSEATVNVPPRFWVPSVRCSELDNLQFTIRYFHFSSDWDSVIETGEEAVNWLESGTVTDGIGFIGGVNIGEYTFTVQFP